MPSAIRSLRISGYEPTTLPNDAVGARQMYQHLLALLSNYRRRDNRVYLRSQVVGWVDDSEPPSGASDAALNVVDQVRETECG